MDEEQVSTKLTDDFHVNKVMRELGFAWYDESYWENAQGFRYDQFKARDIVERIEAYATSRVVEAEKKNYELKTKLVRLTRVVKEYRLVEFVKAYKEARKRGWQDIRIPVVPRVEYTSDSGDVWAFNTDDNDEEFMSLKASQEEKKQ